MIFIITKILKNFVISFFFFLVSFFYFYSIYFTIQKTNNLVYKSSYKSDSGKSETYNSNIIDYYNNLSFSNNINYTYNPKFPNLDSDILVYLSLWQYWWWFWFIFLTAFYYVFLFRILYNRLDKFNPKISTSLKSHGRWGDLIIGMIPIYWCLNILLNSNTLLKMLEWQTESNIFVLRVRGKQWYWVYKLEMSNLKNFFYLNKNIGHNNIFSLKIKDNFFQTMLSYADQIAHEKYFLRTQLAMEERFYNQLNYNVFLKKNSFTDSNFLSLFDFSRFRLDKKYIKLQCFDNIIFNSNDISFFLESENNLQTKLNSSSYHNTILSNILNNYFLDISRINKKSNIDFFNFYIESDLEIIQKSFEITPEYRFYHRDDTADVDFFENKVVVSFYDVFYRPFNNATHIVTKTVKVDWLSKAKTNYKSFFSQSNDYFYHYKKQNKVYIDLSLRLLKSKFILVLPSNINITIITNSFDVVHSWFIPGLGIKMDCVPGRSTHHTFCFDSYGLFYGQCAEICGRFHHHMPIKVALVNYELFLVWFNHILLDNFVNYNK